MRARIGKTQDRVDLSVPIADHKANHPWNLKLLSPEVRAHIPAKSSTQPLTPLNLWLKVLAPFLWIILVGHLSVEVVRVGSRKRHCN